MVKTDYHHHALLFNVWSSLDIASWLVHTAMKPKSWTVRACAVRCRPRRLTDRVTSAARWHFILRQWVTIKPIFLTALAAAVGAAAAALRWVSLQTDRLNAYWPDRPKVRVCRRWPHRARFHVLCLVGLTRNAASWSGRCYSINAT